jgi:hypothetical protein
VCLAAAGWHVFPCINNLERNVIAFKISTHILPVCQKHLVCEVLALQGGTVVEGLHEEGIASAAHLQQLLDSVAARRQVRGACKACYWA